MNLENWSFKSGCVLHNQGKYTRCSEIFQAVCDELGEYYKEMGFRYARSGPHLTIKSGDIKLKIAFWSSRSVNTPVSVAPLIRVFRPLVFIRTPTPRMRNEAPPLAIDHWFIP